MWNALNAVLSWWIGQWHMSVHDKEIFQKSSLIFFFKDMINNEFQNIKYSTPLDILFLFKGQITCMYVCVCVCVCLELLEFDLVGKI